jgi:monoterpene epsilon-lactone hydrolase
MRLALHPPFLEACRSLARLAGSAARVGARRSWRGPHCPSWTFGFEVATDFFRAQGERAFRLAGRGAGIPAARRMIDTLVFRLGHCRQVHIENEQHAPVPGRWFTTGSGEVPLALHLHGGGFVFSPAMTDNLIAAVVRAVGGRSFVPNYRLAPAHPFPSQLEDAVLSYRWLCEQAPNSPIVLTGDSCGAHLVLALSLEICRLNLARPAACVAISPWTDPGGEEPSLLANASYDWMTGEMLDLMAAWADSGTGRQHPLFRLIAADLSPLRRVLIHVGEREILFGTARDFVTRARAAGADVTYESWADMNHNFHGFGDTVEESRQALERIGAFVAAQLHAFP